MRDAAALTTCFVGISFYRTLDNSRLLTSVAQVFNERGEGVISTAIAVLIVAFLGVAMWVGFNAIFKDAADTTSRQVQLIGR